MGSIKSKAENGSQRFHNYDNQQYKNTLEGGSSLFEDSLMMNEEAAVSNSKEYP